MKPVKREAGISLLEVVIAVVLLSAAASILIVTSRTSAMGMVRSHVYGDAATATKEVLESIKLLPFDSLSGLQERVMPHSQGPTVTVSATSRGVAAGDVADISRYDTSTLRYVTLQTEFKSNSGETVTKKFSTILFKP
jgi:hypothetical protein